MVVLNLHAYRLEASADLNHVENRATKLPRYRVSKLPSYRATDTELPAIGAIGAQGNTVGRPRLGERGLGDHGLERARIERRRIG